MGIAAAGAGKISVIAISSSVLADITVKDANAAAKFPKDAPGTHDPNCFRRATLRGGLGGYGAARGPLHLDDPSLD
jgi:hypothetical protein